MANLSTNTAGGPLHYTTLKLSIVVREPTTFIDEKTVYKYNRWVTVFYQAEIVHYCLCDLPLSHHIQIQLLPTQYALSAISWCLQDAKTEVMLTACVFCAA